MKWMCYLPTFAASIISSKIFQRWYEFVNWGCLAAQAAVVVIPAAATAIFSHRQSCAARWSGSERVPAQKIPLIPDTRYRGDLSF